MFQHTAARRRLVTGGYIYIYKQCFNTQPPEGGWLSLNSILFTKGCFNTQPPEGGWDYRCRWRAWI